MKDGSYKIPYEKKQETYRFQHEAAKQLAQILIEALKEVKEEMKGKYITLRK